MSSRLRLVFLCAAALVAIPCAAQDVVTVTKSGCTSGSAVPGTDCDFAITVVNPDATVAATSVTLTDALPAQTTFVGFGQLDGPTFTCTTPAFGATSGTVNCSLASLPPGALANFTMTVRIDTGATGSIDNTATVTTTTPGDVAANNTSNTSTPVQRVADLVTTKTGPSSVNAGTNLTYTITLTNNGPSPATAPNLSDFVPADTTFVSWTQLSGPGFSCTFPTPGADSGTIDCNAPVMAPSTTSTFQYVVKVNPDAGPSISNLVNAASGADDPNFGNNESTHATTITYASDIEITKSGPLTAAAGLPIVYDINIRSAGPSAVDFGFTDVTPPGTTFESALTDNADFLCLVTPPPGSAGTVTCGGNGRTYPAGTSVNVRLTFRVDPDVAAGTIITNTATSQIFFPFTATDPDSSDNTATTNSVVFAAADMSVVKFAAAATVTPGSNITYSITVLNNGPADAQSVTLTDVIPTGTTFVSLTSPAGYTCTVPPVGGTGTVSCTTPTHAEDAAPATFTLVVNVSPSTAAGANIANTATISAATPDPSTTNNNSTAMTSVTAADVSITKTDSPDPVSAGTNITYSLAYAASASSGANSVTISDTIPAGTTFVSLNQPSGPTFACTTPAVGGTGTVTCTNAFLAPGATGVIQLVVNVNSGTPNGTIITNTATIATTSAESNTANNASTTTSTVAVTADVGVTKSGPATVSSTGDLTYTVSVTNSGPADAATVSLSDATPPNTTFQSVTQTSGPAFTCSTPAVGATGTVSCTIATLPAAATASFTLVFRANAPPGSTITNTANVTSATADGNAANNSASTSTSVAAPDLSVTKSDAPDPVDSGNDITYDITLTNIGSAAATTVTLSDAVPANTTFVSLAQTSGPAFTCTTPAAGGGGTVTCTIPSFAPAATATFTMIVRTNAALPTGTTISNTVSVMTADTETSTANNSATASTAVTSVGPDLAVTKSDAPDPVTAGNNITYTIGVSNSGTSAAANVELSDVLPAGTTFVSFTGPGGWTLTTPPAGGTGTVTATTASFAPLANVTFTLVVAVNSGTVSGTVITNTASVTTTSAELSTANNTASTTTTVAALSQADVSIAKTGPATVSPSSNIAYTITVTNSGPAAASSIIVTDAIPAGTTFVSASGAGFTCSTPAVGGTGTVNCSMASLAAAASATLTLTVNANAGTTTVTNTASVSATTSDPNPANNSSSATTNVTSVGPTADLTIAKTANVSSTVVGGAIRYTITAANAGPDSATNVTVVDVLPVNVAFDAVTTSQGTCAGTTTITCAVATLAAGASATIEIDVHATAAGPSSNTVSVSSDVLDPNAGNNGATANVTIVAAAIPLFSPLALLLFAIALAIGGILLIRT